MSVQHIRNVSAQQRGAGKARSLDGARTLLYRRMNTSGSMGAGAFRALYEMKFSKLEMSPKCLLRRKRIPAHEVTTGDA